MKTCYYNFPCHPQEMFIASPFLEEHAKLLRIQIVTMIAELSQTNNQKYINNNLFVDIDENNNIVGLDLSRLFNINVNCCVGERVSIGKLRAIDWINMKYIR